MKPYWIYLLRLVIAIALVVFVVVVLASGAG